MASVGTASVDIIPNMGPLNDGLANALSPAKLGKLGKAGGVVFGAGLAAAGIGKALFDIGAQFDDAYDNIRVETGKTGKAFEGLKKDLKDVVKTTPTDMGRASKAIASLNTRVGLTGKPLQKMARQMLELSRITDTDVNENIAASTRLFGDWGISAKDQSDTLDGLFRLTQATGIGFGDLNRLMVQFGSPLRTLGLDFDFSAAMFSKFEKEGVNIQTMMPGLRMALKNFGKAGKDPQKALMASFKGIKDGTVSLTDAFDIFGGRAAPDMFAAIREGRFDVDDLTDVFNNGKDTIQSAADDTRDFSEAWMEIKNKVLVALEPIATRVFDSIGKGLEALNNFDFEKLKRELEVFSGPAPSAGGGVGKDISDTFRVLKAEAGPILSNLKTVVDETLGPIARRSLPGLAQAFRGFSGAVRGAVRIISGILSGDFAKAWDGVKSVVKGALDLLMGRIKHDTAAVRQLAAKLGGAILSGIRSGASAIGRVASSLMSKLWGGITSAFGKLYNVGKGAGDKIRDGIASLWARFYRLGGFLLDKLKKGLINAPLDGLAALGKRIGNAIQGGIGKLKAKVGIGGGLPVASQLGNAKGGLGAAVALGAKMGMSVSSGYRPGDDGWHGKNRARDFVGGNMPGFAKAIAAKFGGGLLELIHTPLGWGIKNGRKVPLSFWGPEINADHYDHVHVAMRRGGKAGPSMGGASVVYGEGRKDEWWISQEGDKDKNTRWGVEALESVSGARVALFKKGKKKKGKVKTKLDFSKSSQGVAKTTSAKAVARLTKAIEMADALDAAYDDPKYDVNQSARLAAIDLQLAQKGLTKENRMTLLAQRSAAIAAMQSADSEDPNQPLIDAMNAAAEAALVQAAAQVALAEEQRKTRDFAERVHTANKSVTDTTLSAILDRSLGGELSQLLLTLSPRMAT